MKVLELKGYKSLKALNAFHTLLLGLKMLPAYSDIHYKDFFEAFKKLTSKEKEDMVREAVVFVPLEQGEVESLLSFATDPNGIPFNPTNIKNLKPDQIHEAIVAVCMEIGAIEVDLITDDEKKSAKISVLTSEPPM